MVTDHHQPGEGCPIARSSIRRSAAIRSSELCGTAVAWKLVRSALGAGAPGESRGAPPPTLLTTSTSSRWLRSPMSSRSSARTGRLVKRGLEEVRRARRPGMRALMEAAKCEPTRLDEGDLAFRLAPRINAAGRLYRADAGVELFLTDDDARAAEIATELSRANGERRGTEREVDNAAEAALRELPDELREAPGLVLAGEGWHPGVIGIVASRLVERHHRPVVVISLDGEGGGRGSGRSIPGFDLLGGARGLLGALGQLRRAPGGGRAGAASAERLDAFREAFAAHAAAVLGPEDLRRTERIDAMVGGAEPRARPGRGAAPAGAVRHGQPGGAAAGSLGAGPRRAGDGGGQARPLQPAQRLPPGARASPSAARSWGSGTTTRSTSRCASRSTTGTARSSPGSSCASSTRGTSSEQRRRSARGRARSGGERFEAELAARSRAGGARRPESDRPTSEHGRGARCAAPSSPAAPVLASCVSSGASVLAAGADAAAPRRRWRATALRRCADYADARALSRELAAGFAHVVLVDPPAFARLERLAFAPDRRSGGYLHRVWGEAETRFALGGRSSAQLAQRGEPGGRLPATCARPARRAARSCAQALLGSAPHPRGPRRRPAAFASSPSSAWCRASPTAARARSGSYPQRGQNWSARPRFAPTAPATRRASDTSKDTNSPRAPRAPRGPLRRGRGVRLLAERERRRATDGDTALAVATIDRAAVDARLRLRLRPPRRPAAALRRRVHHPPGRGGADLRRDAARHRDALRGAAARHRRGHQRQPRGDPRRVRRGDRPARRRRHQADRDHLREPRRAPGRELPQDDGGDGHRRQGDPDQAGRPPPQHAHARRPAEAEADGEVARDAGDLRAARPPAGDPRDQVGAGGPRLRDPAPAQVRRDQAARRPAAQRARGLRRRRGQLPLRGAERGRDRGRDLRPRQALLLDLHEDDQEGARVQRDLRPDRDAGDRRLGQGLLRRDRRHPLALEAAARALQGLGRDAEGQHVPGAAHDRDRPRGQAAGDPDPHRGDAQARRVRDRRPRRLQGGRRRPTRSGRR